MTDAAGTPRRGRPGHDQPAVLRTAIDLFNRQGYDGTSMGDLAAELGITKSAIYHHVPSKEHLLSEALDEALDGLEAAITAAERMPGATAYEQLRLGRPAERRGAGRPPARGDPAAPGPRQQ